MLYAPQMGIITPARMKVEESIMMVIWVALGGRGRLWGAIFGALLVNYTYSLLTSDMPSAWPFIQGGMFLAVVLFFPQGCVVLWDRVEEQVAKRAGGLAIFAAAGPLLAISLFILTEALGLMPNTLRQDLHGIQPKYILLVLAIGGSALASWRLRQSKLKQVTAVALAGAPLAMMEGSAS